MTDLETSDSRVGILQPATSGLRWLYWSLSSDTKH
jgi:hypothetical protein